MTYNKNTTTSSASQLYRFAPGTYRDRTARPIYALMYLLGFIILYELGTILISPEQLEQSLTNSRIRVVSFVWMQNILEFVGFSHKMTWIATPLAVVVILLALQNTSKSSWRVNFKDFVPMTLECLILALPLIALSFIITRAPADPQNQSIIQNAQIFCSSITQQITALAQADHSANQLMTNIVTGIGAGIYEELVFRLILICILMMIFQDFLQISQNTSIILSVLISAALFSLHHHIFLLNGHFDTAEPFALATFSFRMLAGVYFAAIFAFRGFGIAAGTHAFYDIIAAILNAMIFDAA